jgi:hypothetical protein
MRSARSGFLVMFALLASACCRNGAGPKTPLPDPPPRVEVVQQSCDLPPIQRPDDVLSMIKPCSPDGACAPLTPEQEIALWNRLFYLERLARNDRAECGD